MFFTPRIRDFSGGPPRARRGIVGAGLASRRGIPCLVGTATYCVLTNGFS